MLRFFQFIKEEVHEGGIAHIEHPSDKTFDGPEAAKHAVKTLKQVASGKANITRKIDDKMSYHAIRTPEGKVGVKYKGRGSHYNFSESDIDTQHGHKPYLAHPLKALLKHLHKVLPARPGEYQGGFMSSPETREVKDGHISHTPNTIEYHAPAKSAEGKKLARSKVSTVIHTELKGPHRVAHPITDTSEFGEHPDVHRVSHIVSDEEKNIHPDSKKKAMEHIKSAERLLKGHTHTHMAGHEISLRTYINSTLTSGERPTVEGYKKHLGAAHDRKIGAVKLEKTKAQKREKKEADLQHIEKNKKHFQRSLDIHHHIQQATNEIARGLDRQGAGGFHTRIGGEASGGEGYVANGLKIVDREGFSKANRARSEILKAANKKKEG